jgi:RsiW-degrading membrane proteinase PrsW (M82 family)
MSILNVLIAILAGLGLAVVYAFIVWWFDRYEKEPWPLLVGVFVWGAVPAVILALIVELVLDVPIKSVLGTDLAYNFVGSSVIAPLAEEFFKGLAVLAVFFLFYRRFDGVLDGVVYGSMVGFGFAAVENVLYFVSALDKGGAGQMFILIFMRAFLFGFNHAFFTSLTGIGLALARTSRSWATKLIAPVFGFGLAVLAHALHNGGATITPVMGCGILISLASDWIGLLTLFVILLLAAWQERKWIVKYLADEVASGLITPGQYRAACSYLVRVGERVEALGRGNVRLFFRLGRFYQLMTLLAFRKYQLASFGDERDNRAEVERWRREIAVAQRQF